MPLSDGDYQNYGYELLTLDVLERLNVISMIADKFQYCKCITGNTSWKTHTINYISKQYQLLALLVFLHDKYCDNVTRLPYDPKCFQLS